jgi:RNA polymerase sigma factor (sigma-70 family)
MSAQGKLMVDCGQRALKSYNSIKSLLEIWESLYKELLFIDCAHLVDEIVIAHQGFASSPELDDLRQDAQSRLWEFISETVKPPTNFKNSAKRAIDSQLKQTRRLSHNQNRVIHKLKNLTTTDLEQSPSQKLEQQEILEAINSAYLDLNQPLAEVLGKLNGLGDHEKHRIHEVAAQVMVTRQTIRHWRDKAHRKLKQNANLQDLAS